MREILRAAGWSDAEAQNIRFTYAAGDGADPVEVALSFFSDLGPSSRVLDELPDNERATALERMRRVIVRHLVGRRVSFPAGAWIWSARA